ncbi:MAG: VWA domain-containing protein [Polyangiaceae bacterium]|nr:VWA domain-containing protein [Polyangiaceae bacterium]
MKLSLPALISVCTLMLSFGCSAEKIGEGGNSPGGDSVEYQRDADGNLIYDADGNPIPVTQDSGGIEGGGVPGSTTPGGISVDDNSGNGATPTKCNEFELDFVPRTPTVYVLVDRSGSMNDGAEDFWTPLRTALLPAVEQLESDVRFGFGMYTSTELAQCQSGVVDDLGTIAENNYAAIEGKYTPTQPTTGADTPTSFALMEAADILEADPSPGERYIVLVTDGNPDFCDDVPAKCGQDATIGAMQQLAARGIKTIFFGLEAQKQQPLEAAVASRFANAGDGQPVAWPDADIQWQNSNIKNECQGSSSWSAAAAANPDASAEVDTAGTYSESQGTAEAFLAANPADLVTSLKAKVAGLKSCDLDLDGLSILETYWAQGEVTLQGEPVSQDQWRMVNESQLELLGEACTRWQEPDVSEFYAGFPCEAIVVR